PRKVLEKELAELGVPIASAEKLSFLRPMVSAKTSALEMLRSIRAVDVVLYAEGGGARVRVTVEPLPSSTLAGFARSHERRTHASARLVSGQPRFVFFSNVERGALTSFARATWDEELSGAPWSTSEQRYLEQAWTSVRDSRDGEMLFA